MRDTARRTVLVVERLEQHIVRVIVDAVVERDVGVVLLGEDVELLGEVDAFLLGDLRRRGERGDLARDVDEQVGELVEPERALAVGVLLEDVPAYASWMSTGPRRVSVGSLNALDLAKVLLGRREAALDELGTKRAMSVSLSSRLQAWTSRVEQLAPYQSTSRATDSRPSSF